MARAHYAENVVGTSGGGSLSLLSGATVHVYDQGTTDHIAQTIYDSDAGVGTLSNPLTSDANGKIEFWLDDPVRVDLAISKVGFTSQTRTVDVEAAASGGGSGVQVATVEISSAELLDLHNTPKVLVVAQGPGTIIRPLEAVLHYHPGETPYANGNYLDVSAALGEGVFASFQFRIDAGTALGGVDNAETFTIADAEQGTLLASEYTNRDLLLVNTFGPLTDGDGTATLSLSYRVLQAYHGPSRILCAGGGRGRAVGVAGLRRTDADVWTFPPSPPPLS